MKKQKTEALRAQVKRTILSLHLRDDTEIVEHKVKDCIESVIPSCEVIVEHHGTHISGLVVHPETEEIHFEIEIPE